MRDYAQEVKSRVAFIQRVLDDAHASGIVYGNSGGKDSALVGILCKLACDDTVGLILPCGSKRNFEEDKTDAQAVAGQFHIATRMIDLSGVQAALLNAFGGQTQLTSAARQNIAPRLRMTALYAAAASENRLVAGTGNRSESYVGYFTKWGDGACDLNPIADLTVTEVYEFLRHLGAPTQILQKAPSAGLFDGQTDEQELGVTYRAIDEALLAGTTDARSLEAIARLHSASAHKRNPPAAFAPE
jgi:NAD+ synthase